MNQWSLRFNQFNGKSHYIELSTVAITWFPVYPALISCEEIVKASNDGLVIFEFPVYPALFSCKEIVKAVYPALISCEEVIKVSNDGPVVFKALL
ncbi:17318_t:CDS:2 [Funneliformis caledonium]|uniref:17318_t:CDS:1 n=1 Tax=Funneliformis caledonium TaxID=1117310 RepID=A0A9N8Z5C8_9GLOM|nr:17318_t:CDS:2 [Funneliformis caledonium]